ncbi:ABC-type multidrug transport system, ATPase and permease component [Amycolatopsis arida]|uniref:ABC-type multidrug transport system, ATPase and permease component n=1 Tax=Amycolatopsis arida TaxID=587909 RepID=A0A1I5SZH7_9PSEU|nr:ABC transporter ATP-binding protein [Amycolatopsis arida]TDX96287.1 ABC-type multidrug transport system fused ATPase/permease subunit [Amycolatopsis arida]SFP76173.1 ABC-type multidrug transport system, ATPase and permease component [Amycolatopsis arida]
MTSKPYPAPEPRLAEPITPARFLLALLRARPWLLVGAAVMGVSWLVPGALLPLVVGTAVDLGIAGGDRGTLLALAGLVVALGVAQAFFGGLLEFLGHGMWMHGAAGTQRLVARKVTRLGAALREQARTGEVMAISSSDINHVGNAFEIAGRLLGSVVAFLVVGGALLTISPLLAGIAVAGVPLAVLGMGPLVRLLHRRREVQREELSEVNSLGADIVSGLRVLRGIGGERRFLDRFRAASQRARHAGVEVSRSESWLAGAEVLLPGLVTVAITWLGARLALAGTISVGELVTFYGASAFLVIPVTTVTEAASAITSSFVAATKATKVLRMRPGLAEPERPVPLPQGPLELHDTTTGITAVAGKLTVVDLPGAAAEALAERLARFTDPEPGQPVLVSGVPADRVALAELRERVVYAHNQDVWFSGVLREQLTPPRESGVDIEAALTAADADDIVAALPNGLDELIGERGREVSGGQRQRLNLARALALDADVLLLDEPTSAVDAHTEARITERVATLRTGRTTVVFSQSPLWAAVADETVREVPSCR